MILRPWHAACCLSAAMVLAPGCFYLGPMPTLEENVAPVADIFTYEPGTPIGIGASGAKVMVIATDEDEDLLYFTWWLSLDGYIGNATPVPTDAPDTEGSQVDFVQDPGLDEQILHLEIDDDVNDTVELQWQLQVYQ